MTVYVQRDGSSSIVGVFNNPQPGYAEEAIDDADPAVVAFLASTQPKPLDTLYPSRVALRQAAAQAVTDINTYLQIADTATAAQVRTAVKQLAQDVKLIIQYLATQVG